MVISASFGLCQSAKSGSFLKFCLCFGLNLAIQASKCWNFRHALQQTCDLLKLDILGKLSPYQDKQTVTSRYPRIESIAPSPDKKKVAFTWLDLLFITDTADAEFQRPQLITRLPAKKAHTLIWSQDSNLLLIGLYICENFACNYGDTVLLDIIENKIDWVFSPPRSNYANPCGFSPDGKQIVFLILPEVFEQRLFRAGIGLVERGDRLSMKILIDDAHPIRCPVWK